MGGDLFSSIDSVASELKAPDASRRRDAVDKLDAWSADEARPLLLVALGDADADAAACARTRRRRSDAIGSSTPCRG